QHPVARTGHRANSEGQHAARTGIGAWAHEPACGRLVRDERGSAERREPCDGRWCEYPARLAAFELDDPSGAGGDIEGTAARCRLSDRTVKGVRPAHTLASVRDGAHRSRSRDITA